jgi:hyperosmotically inducible periplasmic protein
MSRIPILALTLALGPTCVSAQSDQQIQASVERSLHIYGLTAVHPSVQNGAVILSGWVNICRDRLLADELTGRIQGVTTIDDLIDVSGPPIPDAQLQNEADSIVARRLHKLGGFGYGSITAHVQDGIVALHGTAAAELAAPTIAAIAATSGVRNVIDRVHRVPPYDSDWRRSHPPEVVH